MPDNDTVTVVIVFDAEKEQFDEGEAYEDKNDYTEELKNKLDEMLSGTELRTLKVLYHDS